MYDIKVEYVDGKTEKFRCNDYYYDDMGDIVSFELDENRKIDIMIHQLRKIDTLDLDDESKE